MAPAILTALTIPVFATLAGGLLAVRFRHLRPLLIACGAGLLLGAAFLDLLPEAIVLGADGAPSPGLYVAGPLARGAFGELIGLPQVSLQPRAVAATLVADATA